MVCGDNCDNCSNCCCSSSLQLHEMVLSSMRHVIVDAVREDLPEELEDHVIPKAIANKDEAALREFFKTGVADFYFALYDDEPELLSKLKADAEQLVLSEEEVNEFVKLALTPADELPELEDSDSDDSAAEAAVSLVVQVIVALRTDQEEALNAFKENIDGTPEFIEALKVAIAAKDNTAALEACHGLLDAVVKHLDSEGAFDEDEEKPVFEDARSTFEEALTCENPEEMLSDDEDDGMMEQLAGMLSQAVEQLVEQGVPADAAVQAVCSKISEELGIPEQLLQLIMQSMMEEDSDDEDDEEEVGFGNDAPASDNKPFVFGM